MSNGFPSVYYKKGNTLRYVKTNDTDINARQTPGADIDLLSLLFCGWIADWLGTDINSQYLPTTMYHL